MDGDASEGCKFMRPNNDGKDPSWADLRPTGW